MPDEKISANCFGHPYGSNHSEKWKMLKNWQLYMLLGVICAYNIQLLGHALVWFDMTAAHVRQFVKITMNGPISNIYSDIIAVNGA